MNKEWSGLHQKMQSLLKKEATFTEGISTLLELRQKISVELSRLKSELNTEEFSAIPFLKADGYHSKTIAYSIWHIYRIEDIVAHTLIQNDEQIFFSNHYQERIGSPIITTGNELAELQIADFSKKLNVNQLFEYSYDIMNSTNQIILNFSYSDLKCRMAENDKNRLESLAVVSKDDKALWLIDYWMGKDIRGLIHMPFSRHWIMHIEACLRIESKLHK